MSPKAEQKAAPSGKALLRQLPLSAAIPVRLLSLDMVFGEFVSVGWVLPGEKERFCEYVTDLSPFVKKDVLRLMTNRLPPFTRGEVKKAEADAARLEGTLNRYLKYTAESDFSSKAWYERYQVKMKLAVEIAQQYAKK